ncbi:MAG: deoxyribose-phosphate aldolase [Candidatus Acetothermia bacterium]|jgi:deoxyribose-phosphate aldolase|nr:deoxyribose-phosphate aldolase [Candidatus Acetothermia bacterium]MDH7505042.1 deoxyribose-phosphate aldolase [Candidatus Acetothermia bacterium]
MTRKELAGRIDHTALGPEVSPERVRQLCAEAKEWGFYGVCVNPSYIELARKELEGAPVKIVTVIGFPHGATLPQAKACEARAAVEAGADELDMVINIAALKAKDYQAILKELAAVREALVRAPRRIVLKAILETGLLSDEEKVAGAILAQAGGADFVKTSTGFGPRGATVEDVRLLRAAVGPQMKIKAAGGIRDYQAAVAMIEAGADRLGTSAGVAIITGAPE